MPNVQVHLLNLLSIRSRYCVHTSMVLVSTYCCPPVAVVRYIIDKGRCTVTISIDTESSEVSIQGLFSEGDGDWNESRDI